MDRGEADYVVGVVREAFLDILTFFPAWKPPSESTVTDMNSSSPQALFSVKEQPFSSLQGESVWYSKDTFRMENHFKCHSS